MNSSDAKIKFSELFKIKNQRNKDNLKQYAVGKYGIKEMSDEKYDISNHKIFGNGDLIIGIGLEEIGISNNINGCVSPVYDVFSIVKKDYFQSVKWTLKKQLWRKRRFISKKSTRREFEVDKNELMKLDIGVVSNHDFYHYYHIFNNVDNFINYLEKSYSILLGIKSFFLRNMFI